MAAMVGGIWGNPHPFVLPGEILDFILTNSIIRIAGTSPRPYLVTHLSINSSNDYYIYLKPST